MRFRIVTISREFGSGGRTIGRETAKALGVACYDQALVTKIAQESGFAESFITENGEASGAKSSFWLGWNNWGTGGGPTILDELYSIQCRVIRELAEKEPCVIVGRCADYVLRERKDCLNVFIRAGMEFKKERIVRLYGEREENPEKRIRDKDRRRSAYYKYYTGQNWGDAGNYHLCLDSSVIGLERCTDIITALVKERPDRQSC